MANLSTIEEEKKKKKKGGQGNKGRKSKKKSTPKEDMKISRGGPPHAPLPGTRWVKGSDGRWMMHEKTDPDRRIRA